MLLKKILKQKQIKAAEVACKALIDAYDNGERNGGSVNWEEVDLAYGLARAACPNYGMDAKKKAKKVKK